MHVAFISLLGILCRDKNDGLCTRRRVVSGDSLRSRRSRVFVFAVTREPQEYNNIWFAFFFYLRAALADFRELW